MWGGFAPDVSEEVSSCEVAVPRFGGGKARGLSLCATGFAKGRALLTQCLGSSVKEGHLVDALALRGDEGRGTLRYARGRGERSLIPGSPNGATHRATGILTSIHRVRRRTQGTETSQYLEERTSTETPLVVASERGPGQWRTQDNRNLSGKQNRRG